MNIKWQTYTSRLVIVAVLLLMLAVVLAPDAAAKGPPPPGGKVLVRGAAVHGANGIMFDAHDQLHIASVAGREILVMEPNTGKLIDRLGPELGVEGPDDLDLFPFERHPISRFDPDLPRAVIDLDEALPEHGNREGLNHFPPHDYLLFIVLARMLGDLMDAQARATAERSDRKEQTAS